MKETQGMGYVFFMIYLIKNFRLYCIRYGTSIIILGGGGYKPDTIKALQENEKLTKENYLLRQIAKEINQRIEEKKK